MYELGINLVVLKTQRWMGLQYEIPKVRNKERNAILEGLEDLVTWNYSRKSIGSNFEGNTKSLIL